MEYKHYIVVDARGVVTDGWSTADEPERPAGDAILLRETDEAAFRLFPRESVFSCCPIRDAYGMYLCKYEDGEVRPRALAEMADEYDPPLELPATATARKEITDALITQQINAITVDDATALRWIKFYPAWTTNVEYAVDYKAQYAKKLYKCRQQHTSQAGWEPDMTPALWALIDEQHAGTADDPIPYASGMELFEGKYYAQEGVVYRCTRSTGQPVYNALSELVDLYVEKVNA